MTKRLIKSTAGQRKRLLQCHPGVGFMVYHSGNKTTVELEFYVNRKTGQPHYISTGQPVEFDIVEEE